MSMPGNQAGAAAGPQAGWYHDPSGSQHLRWWDGSQWTSHLARPPGYPAAPSAPQPPAQLTPPPLPGGWKPRTDDPGTAAAVTGPAPGAAATARANAVGLTGRRSIGKTAGSWKALETRWKVLWTAAAVVVVLGCVGIATEANDGSSPGASSAGAGNGATGGLSPAGQQVQQDGYGSIQQTSVNGLPVALGTNSSGGQELVETWPNATQASEALASTQDTDVMTGNYANITGLSANGDLLIIDGSEEGIQYILSNTGISF